MPTTVETGTSYIIYSAGAADDTFQIPFPYIEPTHVFVEIDGVTAQRTADFTVINSGTEVELNAAITLTAGQRVKVYRSTPYAALLRNFVGGSVLTEVDIQTAFKQTLFVLQEFLDRSGVGVSSPGTGSSNPFYQFTITDAAVTSYQVPLEFSSGNTLTFLNGQLLRNADRTITTGSTASTLALVPTLVVGDVVNLWRLDGEVGFSVAPNSVGSAAIQDDAVTLSKMDFATGNNNRILVVNADGDPSLADRFSATLNQFAAPTAAVSMGSQKITSLGTGTAGTDAVNKAQMDTAIAAGVASASAQVDVGAIGSAVSLNEGSSYPYTIQNTGSSARVLYYSATMNRPPTFGGSGSLTLEVRTASGAYTPVVSIATGSAGTSVSSGLVTAIIPAGGFYRVSIGAIGTNTVSVSLREQAFE